MCIRTRVVHWRATGLLPVMSATLFAAALVNQVGPLTTPSDQLMLKGAAAALVLSALLYAMYFSPQARSVRKLIVIAQRPKA